ncbi:MAG TPA: HEAT repeat domain-containing protein [Candidatus Sulfotelmatobacter sp.]|nr:HEAT repeat domain-containing protein [Candidatus Sulfotelmatobacter sp.]
MLGPAAVVLKAIFAALIANGLLLAFILLRRTYRKWYFARRDARVYQLRQKWDAIISGRIPYDTWRTNSLQRRIVETIALDAFEAAGPEESARLLKFLRNSGLIEKRIFEARHHTGWRRLRSLVALGRTRAPEGIPALAEGLRDRNQETRLAALRGLGRMGCPKAAEEILDWVSEKGLKIPELPLQSALVQCCAERPQMLLPYIQRANGRVREVLGRVLGEVATPSMAADLLPFAGDELDELRAAAARALANSQSDLAPYVLDDLARDPVWFVRLRAIVSLGKLSDSRAIPSLLRGLTDSNRLVRLRAAEALVGLGVEMAPIFEQVVATRDRYGLHAYLTALENSNLKRKLEAEIEDESRMDQEAKKILQLVLQTGSLPDQKLRAGEESAPQMAAL